MQHISWYKLHKQGDTLYAKYIIWNAGLDDSRAGIKDAAGRNINNLWYVDNTTSMAESEEELKSLLLKVKEESEKGSTFKKQRHLILSLHGK